jgi:hypothetical protein
MGVSLIAVMLALTSPALGNALAAAGVELCRWADL